MIHIKTFVFNPFQENTYVVYDDTREAIIIDAGCSDDDEYNTLESFLADNRLKAVKLVNTHCHVDHILGVKHFVKKYNLPFAANKEDYYLLASAQEQGLLFGLNIELPPPIDEGLTEGEPLTFGNSAFDVYHVPGHSQGSVALYNSHAKTVFVGDVLFKGSIGRTDLPGGDYDSLINSIKTKLFTLPNDTRVYTGHGSETSIQAEKDTNPFFK